MANRSNSYIDSAAVSISSACVADDTTKPTIVTISSARRKVTSVFSVMIAPKSVQRCGRPAAVPFDLGRDPEKFLMTF